MKQPNFCTFVARDRVGHGRKDALWLRARLEDPRTRYGPVWRSHNLVLSPEVDARAVFLARHQLGLEGGEIVLLGIAEEAAYFAIDLSVADRAFKDLVPSDESEAGRQGVTAFLMFCSDDCGRAFRDAWVNERGALTL